MKRIAFTVRLEFFKKALFMLSFVHALGGLKSWEVVKGGNIKPLLLFTFILFYFIFVYSTFL